MHHHKLRNPIRRLALALAAASAVAGAGTAVAGPSGQPLPDASRLAIEQLVQTQSKGLPGEISLQLQGSHNLPPCDAPEAFLAPGTELRGRISVGLRCVSPAPWKRYVQAYVAVRGRYYVAAQPIEAGQPLGLADVSERSGDLAALPRSVVT